jgi:hypothetical protein
MVQENSFGLPIETLRVVQQHIGNRIVNLVKATCQSSVRNVAEIEKVRHGLVKVRGIGSITEVSVLLGDKLISLMAELCLNHILESKFVKRISVPNYNLLLAEVNMFIFDGIPEPEEKDGFELVPLPQTQIDEIVPLVLFVSVHEVSPLTVVRVLSWHVLTQNTHLVFLVSDLEIGFIEENFSQKINVFWSSQDHIE